MSNANIITAQRQASFSLGHERGYNARRAFVLNHGNANQIEDVQVDPLSGEWAGESMNEIMRDICGQDLNSMDPDLADELLNIYEEAYRDAFYGR